MMVGSFRVPTSTKCRLCHWTGCGVALCHQPGGEWILLLEYVNLGNQSQYADPAFVDELINWLRFNKKEALSSLDGLYSVCSGNPEVPRFLGQKFVAGTKPQQQADADAEKVANFTQQRW